MSYEKFYSDWRNGLAGGTPIDEAALDHIEQGIADAHDLAAAKADAAHTHASADITDATPFNEVDTVVRRDNEGGIAVTRVTGLSTATSPTSAVPKSQMDSALTGKADSAHTHAAADVTDLEATTEAKVVAMVVSGDGIETFYDPDTHTLAITATASPAENALTEVTYADLPAGTTVTLRKNADGTWPARYSDRADLVFAWQGPDPDPSIVTSGTGGARSDAGDFRRVTP